MSNMNHPLLRYHGGKYRLSKWIISYFPMHDTYVEPFGGGASVLLNKTPSRCEVYNDLDDEIVNFFEVLRDPNLSKTLASQIQFTPYSRSEFNISREITEDRVERARRLVVRAQMGFSSVGASNGNTGFRLDTGRGSTDLVTIWQRQPNLILEAAKRLSKVMIENRDALQVIQDHDRPDTLFFIDPPYLMDVRNTSGTAYKHEMSLADHERLIEVLKRVKGQVILCGYENDLYNQLGWQKAVKTVAATGQTGSVGREEILWINPQAERQQDLFFGI